MAQGKSIAPPVNHMSAYDGYSSQYRHHTSTYRMICAMLIPKVSASTNVGGMGSEIAIEPGGSIYDAPPDETGWDRLMSIWDTDMYGDMSPELHLIKRQALLGVVIGGGIGAFVQTRSFAEDFIRKHREKTFVNTTDAKRFFQDNYLLAMMRGAYQWGWRVGLFSGIYSSITIAVAVYNDKASVWEHILAGVTCGALWKHRQGLRAMGVASLVGGTLGALAGGCIVTAMWLTGIDFRSLRYWHHTNWEQRLKRAAKKHDAKLKTQKENQLLIGHEERLKMAEGVSQN